MPLEIPRDTIIVDIDGVMALLNGRDPYDWSSVSDDEPNTAVITVLQAIARSKPIGAPAFKFHFMTGRSEVCRYATEHWLIKHVGIQGPLHMRPDVQNWKYTPGAKLKRALFDLNIIDPDRVLVVFEDAPAAVKMWRGLGLDVLHVSGDYSP
jgi:hypothetical protein